MKKKKLTNIAIIITILTIVMGNIVFAKYYDDQNTTISNKIATQIINISKEGEESKTITSTQGIELVVNVTNYQDDKISEVGQNYYLQFYSDDIDISKVNISVTINSKNADLENMRTEKKYIKANEKETHKYNIKITSNCNENIKGNIKAKVISEQVNPK